MPYPGAMYMLPDIARVTVERHAMLPEGSAVLALVSGGADSIALLRLLATGELGDLTGRLAVLHVNHLLRGEQADADEALVTALCERLDVPCRVVRYDVAAYAEAEGLNLEDAGRRVRYRFAEDELDARCAGLGVPPERGRIAVAHTADDRLETFLARLVAGAGPGGLGSIAPVRGRIVRPLIDARRSDVTAYLTTLGQPWREDATNADTSRERAWMRHELLPLIERRNPSFGVTAARTMALLGEQDDAIGEIAAGHVERLSRREPEALVFDAPGVAALPAWLARRVVRDALIAAFPEASRIEYEHIAAVTAGLADTAFARDLSCGLRAEAEYDRLRISRRGDGSAPVAPGLLELPGTLELGGAGTLEARLGAPAEVARGPHRVSIDAEAVRWPLVIDSVREGDRMRPLGLGGSKKLSDLLIDAKVPRRLRSGTPVVRDGSRIVWLAGIALAEECRVGPATARVADLIWRPQESGVDRQPL